MAEIVVLLLHIADFIAQDALVQISISYGNLPVLFVVDENEIYNQGISIRSGPQGDGFEDFLFDPDKILIHTFDGKPAH